MRNRIKVYLYVLFVCAMAATLFRGLVREWPIDPSLVVPILGFAAFVVGIEMFEVHTASGVRWIPSATVDLAVWIMFGPVAAMLMEAIADFVGEAFIRRHSPVRVLFNVASLSTAAGLAGWLFHLVPFNQDLSSPLFLFPAVVSHIVFSGVNMGLAAVAIALSENRAIDEVLRSVFSWHFLSGVIAAPLSAFLIFSYKFAGLWSLLLFGIPLYVVYQAHKLFEEMKEAHKNTVAALTTALEADEPYTHGHSYRVAKYAVQIGRRMGVTGRELETLEYAGMLHDIGKIAITNDIVCKPARLTKDEFDILSSHPAIGGEIVEQMKFLRDAAELVRHHHERPDGQGYPDNLEGDQISLGSSILNLCDAVDAMCSNRPYRAALTIEQCVEEIRRFRGTQFDARVVDTFVQMVEEGSFEVITQADDSAQQIQAILRRGKDEETHFEEPAPLLV